METPGLVSDEDAARAVNALASALALDPDEARQMIAAMRPIAEQMVGAESISPHEAFARLNGATVEAFYESEPDRMRRELRESLRDIADAFMGTPLGRAADRFCGWLAQRLA